VFISDPLWLRFSLVQAQQLGHCLILINKVHWWPVTGHTLPCTIQKDNTMTSAFFFLHFILEKLQKSCKLRNLVLLFLDFFCVAVIVLNGCKIFLFSSLIITLMDKVHTEDI